MKIKISKPKIIAGIDFGTTTSLVQTDSHFFTIPSNLHFYLDDNRIKISPIAKDNAIYSIYSIKRLLNEKSQYIVVRNKKYLLVDLISILLNHLLKDLLSKYQVIAVMTVPAKFDYASRIIVAQAAEKLNIKIIRMIAEPTAAAFLYSQKNNINGKFLVYDLGGGTFDLSYVKINEMMLRVLETNGDINLGGNDLDLLIAKKYNLTPQEAKEKKEQNLIVDIDNLVPQVFVDTMKFVQAYSDEIPLILIGGGSILAKSLFSKRPNVISSLNFTHSVVEGAFLYAKSFINSRKFLLIDVLPISIGVETFNKEFDKIIPRNSPLPISIERNFTNQVNGQKGIKFNIYQGESISVDQCKLLTHIDLTDLPPRLAGTLEIKASFKVNLNGMLEFEAFCEEKKCYLSYDLYQGLSDKDISVILDNYNEKQESINKRYYELLSEIQSICRLQDENTNFINIVKLPSEKDIQDLQKILSNLLLQKNFV